MSYLLYLPKYINMKYLAAAVKFLFAHIVYHRQESFVVDFVLAANEPLVLSRIWVRLVCSDKATGGNATSF